MRDSIVFYRSFYEAVRELPDDQLAASVRAIMEYGLNDVVPESAGIAKSIYLMAKPQIDANNKKYLNGTRGGRPITNPESSDNQMVTNPESNQNQTVTKPKPNNNQMVTKPEPNVNDNDNDNDNVNKKNKNFVPPTVGDVADYCQNMGYKVDAESFVDFYTSKGWVVGKSKMRDWKAAVRNWARSQRLEKTAENKPKQNRFDNFDQRSYDYDTLLGQIAKGG